MADHSSSLKTSSVTDQGNLPNGLLIPATGPSKARNQPFGRRSRQAEELRQTKALEEKPAVSDPQTASPRRTAAVSPARGRSPSAEPETKRTRLSLEFHESVSRRLFAPSAQAPGKNATTSPNPPSEPPSPAGSSRGSPIEIFSTSEEEEPDTNPNTAQTTPDTSPLSKLTLPKTRQPSLRKAATTTSRRPLKPRAASDPTPLRNTPLRPQDIDAEIASVLLEPSALKDTLKPTGFVYVAPVTHNGRRLIKIGFTAESLVRKRLKAVQTVCKEMEFVPLSGGSPDHAWIPTHYKRVERLAHAELSNFVYDCKCACRTKHREYFVVDEKVAFGVVDRWARWVRRMPYVEGSGELSAEWKFRLGRFREGRFGRTGRLEAGGEHGRRGARWERFVCANRWDWHWYRLEEAGRSVWPWRWAVCSLVQGGCLAAMCSSVWVWGWLVLMLLGVVMEAVPDLAGDLVALVMGYEVVPPRIDMGGEVPEEGVDYEEGEQEDGEDEHDKEDGEGEEIEPVLPGAWAESQEDPIAGTANEETEGSQSGSSKELRFGDRVIYISSDEEDSD